MPPILCSTPHLLLFLLLFHPIPITAKTISHYQPLQPLYIRTSHSLFYSHAPPNSDPEWESLFSDKQVEGPLFSSGPNDTELLVALTNGVADAQLTYTFVPAENFTIDDYSFVPVIGNLDIIDQDDVDIVYVQTTADEVLAYNVTVDFDFNKWTGISTFGLTALNKTTSETVATSLNADLIVVGITFYYLNELGAQVLVGGPNYPLTLDTDALISANGNYNLNAFIQYFDRSTSNDTFTVPLSGASISTIDLGAQLTYESTCSATQGAWDGTDVDLPQNCAMGFSTNLLNGAYVGAFWGFDFELYQNGSFTTAVEWNQLLQGSDLELDGYSTYILVNLEGEVPPVVRYITPDGPFSTSGTDTATLYVDNLPSSLAQVELWQYFLSISFPDAAAEGSYKEGSAVVFENGTVALAFTLPPGSGTELPWNFTVTKTTSEVLEAVDLTDPKYFFNFSDTVEITGIQPDSGPEEGGTIVSLLGDFPGFDSDSITILFDGVAINSSLILATSFSNITFETPSMESIGSDNNVTVTVTIGDLTSNEVVFTYVPPIFLASMNPTSGPVEGNTQVVLKGTFPNFDPSRADTGVYFGNIKIDSDLIISSNSSVIIFNTPSQESLGSTLIYSYNVSVQISGEFSNPLEFVYDSPIRITSIDPSSGDEAGGTEVTLTGTFASFDPSTSVIYFGGIVIPSSEIQYTDTSLVFTTPPLSEVGSSHTQNVYVTIGQIDSNVVQFTYEDTGSTIIINGGGGSLDPATGYYQVGVCSDSLYRASMSNGVRFQNPVYTWTLTAEDSSQDILSSAGITSSGEVLYVPYTTFPEQDTPYTLTLSVQTSYATYQQTLTLYQLSVHRIGVYINDPHPRSISDPNVTLTIPAELFVPGCRGSTLVVNTTAMTYVWGFRGETYVFSYENKTSPELEVSPTLLGREFHIPQNMMEYGVFTLSLTAYFTEETTLRGSDSTTVVISPAPLIPQINGGEYSQFISETESLTVSGARSRDPDVLEPQAEGGETANISYSWSCRYAWDETMADALSCGDGLMPSSAVSEKEFPVSEGNLAAIRNTTVVHIEYSLQIRKTSLNATGDEIFRVSDTVTSTFILSEEKEQEYEALGEVSVVNHQSIPVDINEVKYYEDVTINPISKTTDTTWTFEVISPPAASRTLLASNDNLLALPGYYVVDSKAGRLSLGFKANKLRPNTEYQILISTFHPDYAMNEHVISFRTVEEPRVNIGSLATPAGTTADIFALSAYTSYNGDFKFFFLLTDEYGYETCVGGCQGENVVKFRLATAGSYLVRCDVYDWIGFTLLASASGNNITVTNLETDDEDLAELHAEASEAFLAGDHATFQQLGSDMVKFIWNNDGSTAQTLDSEILANFTEGMNQVASNAVPNAIQSAGYVSTAAALASLTPNLGITYDTETLYFLVNITVNAIERVPDNGALQVIEDLLQFYDLSPALVLASYPEGTSRRRLLQRASDTESEVLDIWLDLYEVMKRQIAVSLLKRCNCGCVEEVTTGIRTPSSIPFSSTGDLSSTTRAESAAASYVNPSQGSIMQVNIKVAHFCNSEQGSQLIVNEGVEGEVSFSWCKEIFEDSEKKLYFGLAVTPDYIYLSRLYQNTTLTDGLVATMITTLNGNEISDATIPIEDCYKVRIPLPRNLTENSADVPDNEVPKGLLFAPTKEWGVNSSSSVLYMPIFSSITTAISDSAVTADTESTTALLTMSTTGVLAVATRAAWEGAIFSFEGFLILAAVIAGVTVLVFVLVLMATTGAWLVATRMAATGMVAPVEADFTYVERDIYGRGTILAMVEEQDAAAAAAADAAAAD